MKGSDQEIKRTHLLSQQVFLELMYNNAFSSEMWLYSIFKAHKAL